LIGAQGAENGPVSTERDYPRRNKWNNWRHHPEKLTPYTDHQ